MIDRDWIRRVMAHKNDLPVPYHFAFSPPARARAQAHYGEDLDAALQFPIRRGIEPGITLQDDVPPANMFAAIDEAMRGRFAA
ncbi:MAG: hypothetical protein JW829_11195 [Pirellulales bacterium]|nr:hypothetical protein [Pirellulales bacterium]